jgi:hypothetical protein
MYATRRLRKMDDMSKGQNLKMVGYLRVSTGKQARSGLGEAAQRAKITAAATLEGWDLVG